MGRFSFLLGFAVVVGTAGVACESTPADGWNGAYHSAHFDYRFHADDQTVCPGVMESLEEHRVLVSGYLGIDPAALPRVTYSKYRDWAEFTQLGIRINGWNPGGCSDRQNVWSPVAFHEHELIHTISIAGWGESVSFLQEGIATALSCTPSASEVTQKPYDQWDPSFDVVPYESNPSVWALNEWRSYSLQDYFDVRTVGTVGYAVAGALVTYLLDTGGPSTFHRLWSAVPPTSTVEALSQAMSALYGFSLEEAWQHLRTTRHRPCAPVWMCSFPPLTVGEQGSLAPSCTGKSIARTTLGDHRLGYPKFSRAVYDWFATANGERLPISGISLVACGGNPADQVPRSPAMQYRMMDADLWLPPLSTPHVVTVESLLGVLNNLEPGRDSDIAIQTSALAPAVARCSEAAANVIPPQTTSALWLPNDGQTRFSRFQLAVRSRGDLYFHASLYNTAPGQPWPEDVQVSLCAGCDGEEATGCTGCPLGTTDCIVRFKNASPAPLWLRIVAGDYWDTAAPPSGTDAVSTVHGGADTAHGH